MSYYLTEADKSILFKTKNDSQKSFDFANATVLLQKL